MLGLMDLEAGLIFVLILKAIQNLKDILQNNPESDDVLMEDDALIELLINERAEECNLTQ